MLFASIVVPLFFVFRLEKDFFFFFKASCWCYSI